MAVSSLDPGHNDFYSLKKELSLCQTLLFSNPHMFATQSYFKLCILLENSIKVKSIKGFQNQVAKT